MPAASTSYVHRPISISTHILCGRYATRTEETLYLQLVVKDVPPQRQMTPTFTGRVLLYRVAPVLLYPNNAGWHSDNQVTDAKFVTQHTMAPVRIRLVGLLQEFPSRVHGCT
jgi:hypothetical protein